MLKLRRMLGWPSVCPLSLALCRKGSGEASRRSWLPAISQLHLQPGSHVCALCFRKDGDSEFMNIIANEIGPEVRGA